MDLFKNLFQPTIVHIGENTEYKLSNKYCLNYNIVQIDWFQNNSIVLEDGTGIILLETADINNPYSASSNDVYSLLDDGNVENNKAVLDIPRIYFPITKKFYNNGEVTTPLTINSFIISLLQLSDKASLESIVDLIVKGNIYDDNNDSTDDVLVPGEDYFINKTFADYLISCCLDIIDEALVDPNSEDGKKISIIRSIELPNYLKDNGIINEPWVELMEDEQSNTDLLHYLTLNKYEEYGVTDDVLNEFYINFINGILNYNTDKQIITTKDALYKAVLDYFSAGQNDETVNKINLVLGSTYSGQQINTASSYCNCKGSSNASMTDSCSTLYSNAMLEHLKMMLGDPEFYCSWMFDDTTVKGDLIEYLKYLILRLKDRGFTLSNGDYGFKCPCPNDNTTIDEKNYKILDNYIKVLDFVNQCNIKPNINKIKLWGSQFGELLPKLYFI